MSTTPQVLGQNDGIELEEILVTGTHIQGLDMEGANQAIQINRDDILESGAGEIGQLMQDLSVTGGGSGTFTTSTAGALSGDTPAGASSVSLRGLGTGSTLTLINGRRSTVSSFANGQASFIDINSIPASAIERIEILPNGASATYGADAVAGVVNYVLRKDFDGVELSASYGDSTANSDDGKLNLSLLVGGGNDRHRVMAIVDYYQRNALFDRDRDSTRDSVRPSQQGFYPSFNDLFLTFFDQTEEPNDGGCASENFGFGNFGEFCEVNTNAFTSTNDDYESIGGLLTHEFQINDSTRWFNEFIYQQTEADGTSSPANFSRTPIDPQNPFWPQALVDDLVQEGGFEGASSFSDFFGFPIYAWGKFPEPRAVNRESETLRLVTGIEKDFSNGWNVESAIAYGRNESEQRGISGLLISQAFYDANLGNLCTDGTRVERWDVDLVRPDASFIGNTCEDIGKSTLWYNPFGGQTQQAVGIDDAIRTQAERNGKSDMWSIDAIASGPLFDLNGRTVQAAFGAEWRNESVKDTPSGVAVSTTLNPEPILGFSSTSADADRTQWAVFSEFFVPLTDQVDMQLAGRYDHYDSFGGDFNPKVSFRWKPNDQLIMRANYSTSFRAPSLAQVGAGTLLSSYTVDCQATPAACDNDASADGEALLSEDVANNSLSPEEADTWGAGLLFTPSDDLTFTLDYWNISYQDIVGIDEDDFIRRALNGAYPVVGRGMLDTGIPGLEIDNGFVIDAHFELSNLGSQDVSGIDATYTQFIEVGRGTLKLTGDASYLLEFERQSSPASPVIDEAGEFLFPQLLLTARARYRINNWAGSITARFTDDYLDDPSSRTLEAVGLPSDAKVEVDSHIEFDLNLSYDISDSNYISFNVRNLFDEQPPRVLGLSSNVDQINHSSIGRYITLRYTHRF